VDHKKYLKIIDKKYKRKRFYLSVIHRENKKAKKYYKKLKSKYNLSFQDRLYNLRLKSTLFNLVYRILRKIKKLT
ncbi:MAG: hypothetical protein ACOCRX_10275, partial [Candidatus Woesearchaeota archaeon]